MKTKVLITGCYGFIGSNLRRHLRSKYAVFALESDLTNASSVMQEVRTVAPNVIVHCGAIVGSITCDIAGSYAIDVNVKGSYNIARAAKSVGAKLIYIGSTASYKTGVLPITEETQSEPETLYGMTKHCGEAVCQQICENLLVLRFCYAFGSNDGHSGIWNMINSFKSKRPCILQMSPESLKDYMHVDDFCRAVEAAIENNLSGLYNVSHNEPRKLKEVISVLNSLGITPILYYKSEDDYLGDHVVNSGKFRKATGWKPEISLEDGIKRVVGEMYGKK